MNKVKFYEHGIDWIFGIDDFATQTYSKQKYKNRLDAIQKFFDDWPGTDEIESVLEDEIYERKQIKQENKVMGKVKLVIEEHHYKIFRLNGALIVCAEKRAYKNRGEFLKWFFELNPEVKEISCPQAKTVYRQEQFIKNPLVIPVVNKEVPIISKKLPVKYSLNYIISDKKTLTVYLSSGVVVVPQTHINYLEIVKAVKDNDEKKVKELFNIKENLEKKLATCNLLGKITVGENSVLYDGKEVHNYLTEQIVALNREGLPWERLGKFLERLMKNPHKNVFDELYRFLSNKNMPITEDGCFISWKKVNDKYLDFHSETVDNTPGKCPEMPRFEVDDNTRLQCSVGLHVGSREYVHGFYSGQGKIVLVKVAPEDVVCVPENEPTKVRVWRYEVLRDMTEDEFFNSYYHKDS